MKILIPSVIIILLFSISSCYYDSKEFLYPQISKCDTAHITYTFCVKPILDNCLGCHSNSTAVSLGGSIKLQDYADVKTSVDNGKLLESIKQTGAKPMPKNSSKLPGDEITIIEKWISKGALDN